jgi:hypothetical protein
MIAVLLLSLLIELDIQPVVVKQDYTPPRSADPFVGIWHNRGVQGMWTTTLTSDKVSKSGGLSIARKQITVDMQGRTVWTDGVGIYGYDGIDGELATALLATGKTEESRAISRKGMLEEWAIPEKVVIRNGTIVAPKFTNLPKEVLSVSNVTFVTTAAVVGDDEKLPITFKALSLLGNDAIVNNVQWTVNDPMKATWQIRGQNDPGNVAGYLVPIGPLGVVTLTATGTNRKGQQVSGSLNVEIVPGAATVIIVESLEPINR